MTMIMNNMINSKLIFLSVNDTKDKDNELRVFTTKDNELCVQILDKNTGQYHEIALTKRTAIKFSKETRRQIALLKDDEYDFNGGMSNE